MTTIFDSLRSRHLHTRSRQTRRDGRRPGRRAVFEFQPGSDLIALEERTLLSSVNWINPAGGDWDTGSNWNTGSVPGASDDVTLDLSPGITVTHSQDDADSVNTLTLAGADTLSISSGSLSIDSASTIDGPLNLSGGALEGAGTLTVTGALTWAGGTMAGAGQTIATGNVSINDGTLDTRSFSSAGTATLSGTLSFDNSAGFINASTATFNALTFAALDNGDSSSPTFSNAGSFDVQANAEDTVTDNGVAFTSAGTVAVSSGTLDLFDPGGTDSGSFTVASNATLDFGETATTLSSQSSVSGDGTVTFDNNGTTTIDGVYNVGSLDTTVYATADQPGENGGPFGSLPPTYSFGTMDLTTGQFTPISTTGQLINSLTAGPGGALYAGASDGTLYTISPAGATSQFGTVSVPSNSATAPFVGLASEGAAGFFTDTVTQTGSPFTATLDHISADGKTLSVIGTMGDSFVNSNTGNLAFGPDGNLYFDTQNASGVPTLYSVNTTTGALTEVGSGLNTANPLTLVSSGTALYGIDTYTAIEPGQNTVIYTIDTTTGVATAIGTVSGLDYGFTLDTMAPHAPIITPSSSTIVQDNAVVNFDATLTSLGGELDVIDGGTANLGSNSVSLENMKLASGTLTGTGTLTVTGALGWYGGTMAGTGQTIAEGPVYILNGTLDTRSFTSYGTATLTATLTFDHGARFTSAAMASFYAENGASLALGDGSAPLFNNAGTFDVQAALSVYVATDNGVAFTNTGTVNFTGGTLSLSDMTLTNNSVINQSGSSTLQVNSGAWLKNTSSGTYTLSAGTLQVDGTIASGSAVTVPTGATLDGVGMVNGTVNVQAGGHLAPGDASDTSGILHTASTTLTTGANFDVELNGATAGTKYNQLNATGTVNLAGATLNLAGSYTPVTGDVFTIVTAASVTGKFKGLAPNSIITFNGRSLKVSYTPTTVTLTNTPAASSDTIAWPTPAPIGYGTALGTTQLDATASYRVPGTYTYTTASGRVLNVGSVLDAGLSQILTVRFTPSDSTDYKPIIGMTTLSVVPATLTFRAVNKAKKFKAPNPSLTFTVSGLVLGQSAKKVFKGAPVLSTTGTTKSPIGQYPIFVRQGTLQLINKNYTFKFVNGILQESE